MTLVEGSLKFLFLKVIFARHGGCILFVYGFLNYSVDSSAYIASSYVCMYICNVCMYV
jgi:hypothetical protein